MDTETCAYTYIHIYIHTYLDKLNQLNSHILRPLLININLLLPLSLSLSFSLSLSHTLALSIIELYTTTGDLMNCNSVETLKCGLVHFIQPVHKAINSCGFLMERQ
ncbi:uncharacterized protein DC041_0008696 [Schistosoma bovis]|uniref:Uncharacterized protein n=1 Tax=Schistosoma bovis TaxID=6184 RepID=A0A430Q0F2_SCHBO|nr:uncharacterized protein DC041_0008696 [Schistosoma bovis]